MRIGNEELTGVRLDPLKRLVQVGNIGTCEEDKVEPLGSVTDSFRKLMDLHRVLIIRRIHAVYTKQVPDHVAT